MLESTRTENRALQAKLDLAQQDKLTLQGELKEAHTTGGAALNTSETEQSRLRGELTGAEGLLQSTRTEKQALQAKLEGELKVAAGALKSIRKEKMDWQAKLDIALGLGLEVYMGTIYMMCYHGNLSPIRNDRGCQNARILVYVRLVFG